MATVPTTEPITVRTGKDLIAEIDAIAAATDRSRNYVVNQALRQFLDQNAWQIERIRQGIADADAGRVEPAEDVHARIAAKHGWAL